MRSLRDFCIVVAVFIGLSVWIGRPVAGQVTQPGIPSGLIFMFNSTTCPTGSTEFTSMRGFYPVGLLSGGTLNTAVGSALTNLENRPSGQHTHVVNITDPGHNHNFNGDHSGVGGGPGDFALNGAGTVESSVIINNTTGITATTSNPSGSVAGTNAPYKELLFCQQS